MSKKEESSAQLGMRYSTAVYRLLRDIIYSLAVETNRDLCFRCNGKITRDDFSIEHKKPWLHVSPDLFWDMNNIAFSHNRCNSGAARKINKPGITFRKTGPKGTSWCNRCEKFLPVFRFSKNSSSWNGLQNRCIDCRKLRNKRH